MTQLSNYSYKIRKSNIRICKNFSFCICVKKAIIRKRVTECSFILKEELKVKKTDYIENIVTWEEEFIFAHPVKVRFSETDMFGHLNNTVPFVYFEEARIEYFKSLNLMDDWVKEENETFIVVADLQCDYMKQVYFDEHLLIYVKAGRIGQSSVDIHYMGKRENGDICFTGRGTIVQVSKLTGKGAQWTDEMKLAFHEKINVPQS